MKKIALCISLCAGLLISAASAQSFGIQPATFRGSGNAARVSQMFWTLPTIPQSEPSVNVSRSVSTSCNNGVCTVTVNGVLRGTFEGSSVSVSSSSVNGVSSTKIYVDGRLVDEF